jgi:hypothetical protein
MENETTTPSAEFFKELAAAQSEFGTVRKNRTNPATHSEYADLQSVFDAVKPALNKHGFFIYQRVTTNADSVSAETFLAHASGQTLSSGPFTVPSAGLMNRGTNAAQAIGSARTYACRYSVVSFLCLTADDDDDGNAANAKPQSEFVLTQDMVDAAKRVAAGGVAAYKAYYEAQSTELKTALSKSGWHRDCYNIAKKADAGAAS